MTHANIYPLDIKSKTHKPTLVLLHGWGYDNTCWPKKMLNQLRSNYDLILLDLPGHGQDTYVADERNSIEQLDEWIVATKRLLPSQYNLMGWSLGAQIAIRMAHNDSRIQSIMLMSVNPKFISCDDWPAAMSRDLLMQFKKGYETLAAKTLLRFASLQSQGSSNPKLLAAQMIRLMPVQAKKAFGLTLLEELDEREHFCQISQPCCLQLAEDDELVPCTWVDQLELPNNVQVNYVAGGHGYFLGEDGIGNTMANFFNVGVVR